MFQSTHPCGVRLALTKFSVNWDEVSIHAPLRGATLGGGEKMSEIQGFNPRTPAGCDFFAVGNDIGLSVSIHAPLRGATSSSFQVR